MNISLSSTVPLAVRAISFEGSRQSFQAVIDCIARRPEWQLILTTGSLNVAEFSGVPENALLVKAAPQLEVLKRASIMIGHGGFNSVKECIYFGVPMILFPVIRDHPAIAARAVYHGLGVRGELREASVEQIDEMINRVDGSTFRTRIGAMAKIFRADEAASPSVKVIEEVIATIPVNRFAAA